MLVLSGIAGDEFVLTGPDGTETRVVINELRRGGRVALAFSAPRSVTIDRLAVHEAKQLDKKELTRADPQACQACGEAAHYGSCAPPSYHPRPGA